MNADTIIKALYGTIVAILGILWADAMRRIRHLETDTLRKSDLEQLQRQLAQEHQDNQKGVESNSDRLAGIEGSVTGVHRRIDDLYKALVK